MAEQTTVEQLQRDLEAHAKIQAEKLEQHSATLRTQADHAQQHRGLIDDLREGAVRITARLDQLAREYAPKPFGELVQELKAHFAEPGAVTALEQRIGSALTALEARFMPAVKWENFIGDLEKHLNAWMTANLDKLEQKTVEIVRRELASIAPTPAAEQVSTPAPVAPPTPPQPPDPSAPFRTLEEHVAQGFYADTYEFQKAEYEAKQKAALAGKEPDPAPVEQEASTQAAPSGAPPETV